MSEQEGLDIGRVIGLIMENPKLIEEISNLAKQGEKSAPQASESGDNARQVEAPIEKPTPASAPISTTASHRSDRTQLLNAFKPYLSSERARAIDSMISIVDIIDMMRAR